MYMYTVQCTALAYWEKDIGGINEKGQRVYLDNDGNEELLLLLPVEAAEGAHHRHAVAVGALW